MTEPGAWTNLTLDSPLIPGPDGAFEFNDPDVPPTNAVFYRLLKGNAE